MVLFSYSINSGPRVKGGSSNSGLFEALIISFDGGSNDGWFNLFHGVKGEELTPVANFSIDLGSHYHVIGSVCEDIKHYDILTAAGKVLGLQSYGKVVDEWTKPIMEFFKHIPYWHELDSRLEKLSNTLRREVMNETGSLQKQDLNYINDKLDKIDKKLAAIVSLLEELADKKKEE